MPVSTLELAARFPYAFHVCGQVNFRSIRASRILRSARSLLAGTPHEHLLSGRRPKTERISVGGVAIEVRDHRPLAEGSLALPANYGLNDFIAELNSRVFLWAGTEAGPVRSGRKHVARYSSEGTVYLLRVPTKALLDANPNRTLEVTFCNSGAARHNKGLPANRGPATFVSLANTKRDVSAVVELTFTGEVALPEQTQCALGLHGQWQSL